MKGTPLQLHRTVLKINKKIGEWGVISKMPYRLSTLLGKLDSLSNKSNALLIKEFYEYTNRNNLSENHKLNNIRVVITFSNFLESRIFIDITNRNEILEFLDTKIKTKSEDPDGKWITT
jgi:integrase/recombinase XerD